MNQIRGNEVINGTFGEVWVDGSYMAEVTGLEASISIDYEDINVPRKLSTAKKMLGYAGEGTLTFHKVSSRFIKLLSDDLKAGKQTAVTIISKLDDPDAQGAERVALKNVTFEGLNLANWEAKAAGEDEISFAFEEWEMLDLI